MKHLTKIIMAGLVASTALLAACDDSGYEVAESAEELVNDAGRALEDATD